MAYVKKVKPKPRTPEQKAIDRQVALINKQHAARKEKQRIQREKAGAATKNQKPSRIGVPVKNSKTNEKVVATKKIKNESEGVKSKRGQKPSKGDSKAKVSKTIEGGSQAVSLKNESAGAFTNMGQMQSSMVHPWDRVKINFNAGMGFTTPVQMWDIAREYFTWCIDNPLEKAEAIKSGENCGRLVTIPVVRVFTLEGCCLDMGITASYFRTFKNTVKNRISTDEEREHDKNFLVVIALIEEMIYRQKYENAAANLLNANMICRDLGLQDGNNTMITNTLNSSPQNLTINVHSNNIPIPQNEDDVEDINHEDIKD